MHLRGALRRCTLTIVLAGGLPVGAALADTVDPAVVMARIHEYDGDPARLANRAARAAWVDTQLAEIDLAACNMAQLADLGAYYRDSAQFAPKYDARLAAFSAQPTVDGFSAIMLRMQGLPMNAKPEQRVALIREMAAHPALRAALAARMLDPVFPIARQFKGDDLKAAADALLRIIEAFDDQTSPTTLVAAASSLRDILDSGADRARVLAGMDTAANWLDVTIMKIEEESKGVDDPARRSMVARDVGKLRSLAELLRGPAMRGTLIGNAAPAMQFDWVSGDQKWKTLADLKGNVVVLDFWASWCAPCVGSFPQVRKLVERYKGFPVVVLGVTSLQGFHQQKGSRVDCADNPQKEYGLMPGFMSALEVTWPIVFSKQPVFNPQFGVNGIPHIALIAPDGKVAFNTLRFGASIKDECDKIDGLLKAAGLKTPAPFEDEAKPTSAPAAGANAGGGGVTTTVVAPAPPK